MSAVLTANPQAGLGDDVNARHFGTAHLNADLKGRTVRGGAVMLSAQAAKFALQTGATAILARLLTPADFGVIAMVAAITGLIALFKDLGLSAATVQRHEISHQQVSTLFWINLAAGAVLALIGMAMAPLVAWLYGEPRLTAVMVALSCTFLFSGLAAQHSALLQRQMRFVPLAAIEVLSLLAGIVAAIALARAGFHYWALVAMTVVTAVATAVGSWIASGWRPGWPRRGAGVRPMLAFGGYLTGFNFLNYFTRNFDNVLVGVKLGAGPLGIYSRAYSLLLMPVQQINMPLSSVVLPALCRVVNEPAQYRRYLLRSTALIATLGMPLVAFAFADARELVLLLLGPQWEQAVPIFRWLAPAAFVGTLNVVPGWLCQSMGRTRRQFYWAAVAAPLTVIAFLIGIRWGIVGVAAAFSASWCLLMIAFIWYACLDSPVRPWDLARVLWRPALAATAAAACVFLLRRGPLASLDLGVLLVPVVDAAIFAAAFLAALVAIPGGAREVRELLSLGAELRRRSL